MWDFPLSGGFEGSLILMFLDACLELTAKAIQAMEDGTLGQGGVLIGLCGTQSSFLAGLISVLERIGAMACA